MKQIKYFAVILFLLFAAKVNAQLVQTVVSLSGEVYDATTKAPISVNVELFGEDKKRVNKVKSNAKDGSYFFTGLKPGATYEIRVAEFEYMRQSFVVSLPNTTKYAEFSHDITLIPKKVGTKYKLSIKAFELHKTKIKFGADVFLNDYVELLKANPTVKMSIRCFPDVDGDVAQNVALTSARGESLREYFVANGIDGSRFSIEGSGTTDPNSPPPSGKASKGKRYTGPCYFMISSF
jgi:outer membrane protein OmpA-like peptidoglycan-associated protein